MSTLNEASATFFPQRKLIVGSNRKCSRTATWRIQAMYLTLRCACELPTNKPWFLQICLSFITESSQHTKAVAFWQKYTSNYMLRILRSVQWFLKSQRIVSALQLKAITFINYKCFSTCKEITFHCETFFFMTKWILGFCEYSYKHDYNQVHIYEE